MSYSFKPDIKDDTCYLDIPLHQPDALECVAIVPELADLEHEQEHKAVLETILNDVQIEYLNKQFKTHIWFNESLRIRLSYSPLIAKGYYIHGISHYGDCVDDEWLMIYIMHQLTLRYPKLFVRLTDADGDLLLIQAAEELPDWMEPENTRNRAWVHQGKILIIPPEYGDHGPLDFPDALKYLQTHVPGTSNSVYYHNEKLDVLALERASVYPEHSVDSIQRANIYVPRKVAALLHAHPQLIALACLALERVVPAPEVRKYMDAAAVAKVAEQLNKLEHISLNMDDTEDERDERRDNLAEKSETSMVLFAATFTKLVYARFVLDPSNPPSWFSVFIPDDDSVSYEASMLGTKVTIGLDLLLREHSVESTDTCSKIEEGKLEDDEALFRKEVEEKREMYTAMPYMKNKEKEALFDSLLESEKKWSGRKFVEDVNAMRIYEEEVKGKMPTNLEIAKWNKTVDSSEWLYELLNPDEAAAISGRSGAGKGEKLGEENREKPGEEKQEKVDDKPDAKEFDDMKTRLGGLFTKVQDYLEEEDDSSSSEEEEEETRKPGKSNRANKESKEGGIDQESDVEIDEDDFFEFFLKEALKLTPEQIEGYRRVENKEEEDEEDEAMMEELRYHGVLKDGVFGDMKNQTQSNNEKEGKDSKTSGEKPELTVEEYEAMLDLVSSLSATDDGEAGSRGKAPTGPAAAMFSKMGLAHDPMFQKMMGFRGD